MSFLQFFGKVDEVKFGESATKYKETYLWLNALQFAAIDYIHTVTHAK
jgi:hypothetical protein